MDLNIDIKANEDVFLLSIVSEKFQGHATLEQSERSLIELKELMRTLKVNSLESFCQNKKAIEPATVLGSGKLKEIALLAKKANATRLVFDFELTASQMRNIAKITELEVSDRCQVILQIFAQHAKTKEAKLQIEISRYQYLLPRLSSMWTHFSKQKGGIGMKGEGEQQLELDRRIIRNRIERNKKQLIEVQKSKKEQSKKRELTSIKVALVGYTNAGKSSLLNRLCNESILEEDKLFATLDSTYRLLTPDTKPPLVLIDTVGFISNLPNTLIEGFKSTLMSIAEADLLINVVDVSDPHFETHIETTKEVLKELKQDHKDTLYVFNKKDLLKDEKIAKVKLRKFDNKFVISSNNKDEILALRKWIIDFFLEKQIDHDLFIPYQEGKMHANLQKFTNILISSNHEKGVYYKIKTLDHIFQKLQMDNFTLSGEQSKEFLENNI